MRKIKNQIRQGDVLLNPVNNAPEDAREIPQSSGRIVLATGEATGHAHTIAALPKKVRCLEVPGSGERYLVVKEPVVLQHQEHAEAKVPPGTYLIKNQVEVWMDEIRSVMD